MQTYIDVSAKLSNSKLNWSYSVRVSDITNGPTCRSLCSMSPSMTGLIRFRYRVFIKKQKIRKKSNGEKKLEFRYQPTQK